MKSICGFAVIVALAGNASASSSTFYGTSGVDTIVVGRAFDGSGYLRYYACINGTWDPAEYVYGSSDTVTVWAYGGSDTIKIRDVDGLYNCGGDAKYLYRMDYAYVCPGAINVYASTGNDILVGAQCAENLQGSSGADSIFGGGGYDTIYGGSENDCISDTTVYYLSCGDGTDSYTDSGSWNDCETPTGACYVFP